ncbi:F-box protein [Scheffersomyces xylosifermentans]|uniref:F-box protein n=1 Tax=Scheffersomyces xylosifermentans TaxID=1304137 RepID=UPI00315DE623
MSGGTSILGSHISSSTDHASTSTDNDSTISENDHEAIAFFEKAIEKESHGSMSDAVEYYRKAFRLNDRVDVLYRQMKVPHAANKLKQEGGKNTLKKLDEDVIRKINVDDLLESFRNEEAHAPDPNNPEHHDDLLTIKFANLGVDNEEKFADVKPVSPLTHLPNDIWIHILEVLLISSPESWFKFSITCKKHAYLGFGSSDIWRQLAYLVYANQVYEENKLFLDNMPLGQNIDYDALPIPRDQLKILPQFKDSWKYMLNHRPFVKFLGCYISVVNYYSEGGKAEFSNSMANPVRTITYYRYIRFYPDGTCVKVLSSLEPNRVIPHLSKENSSGNISGAVADPSSQAPVKEDHRMYRGTWTVSSNGEVSIEIKNGSVPYYNFHYNFQIKSLGGVFKHNKLAWSRSYAIRKKTSEDDDREGEETEFSLRNEKPFKFSRVRSYKLDN